MHICLLHFYDPTKGWVLVRARLDLLFRGKVSSA